MLSNYLYHSILKKIIFLIFPFFMSENYSSWNTYFHNNNFHHFSKEVRHHFSFDSENNLYTKSKYLLVLPVRIVGRKISLLCSPKTFTKTAQKISISEEYDYERDFKRIETNIKRNSIYLNIIIYTFVYYLYWGIFKKLKRNRKTRVLSVYNDDVVEKKEQAISKTLANDTINDTTEKYILDGLENLENNLIFLQKNITLGKIATELNTNVKYLSIVIKKNKAENFSNYINQLRINYIVEKLSTQDEFAKYKISHLSDLCGYSSPATFTKSFFEIMKQTPSDYIKSLNK